MKRHDAKLGLSIGLSIDPLTNHSKQYLLTRLRIMFGISNTCERGFAREYLKRFNLDFNDLNLRYAHFDPRAESRNQTHCFHDLRTTVEDDGLATRIRGVHAYNPLGLDKSMTKYFEIDHRL
ncbi:MAG: hypothetical protein IH845_04530 [Nanoarchaeota archaeon]|nr:hypothetical protein [Nanoarchaeota archaeon]